MESGKSVKASSPELCHAAQSLPAKSWPTKSLPATSWIETNGLNQIPEAERGGHPRDLFWPWFAANVSVFTISNGAFVVGFGISLWQSIGATILGVVASYFLCGLIAVAGKRASAPTMTISRSVFGAGGNALPSALSWLLTVGWETALVSIAALASGTIMRRMGWQDIDEARSLALALVVVAVAGGALLGFGPIMRIQRWITWITGILTIAYIGFIATQLDFEKSLALPSGPLPAVIGAVLFVMAGFGFGWVNSAADYSRYLPRSSSGRSVLVWTMLGSGIGPIMLVIAGAALAASSPELGASIANDPVGALATLLPGWLLLPFLAVTVLGLVGGAIMNVYSSGFCLLNAGVAVPRWLAVIVDSLLMLAGSLYVVFYSPGFLVPFQGFLITLGVPVAAWCGVFLADLALRSRDYESSEFFSTPGQRGYIRWIPVALMAFGTAIGWGLVTNNAASWLRWQGYFLDAANLGGRDGLWANANLGVIGALLIGFAGHFAHTHVRTLLHRPAAKSTR